MGSHAFKTVETARENGTLSHWENRAQLKNAPEEMERERGRRRERGCAVIVTLKVWFDKLQCGVRLLNNICRHTLIPTLMPLQDFFVCPSQIRLGLVACYLYAQYFFMNRLLPANCGWSLKMSTRQISGQFLVRIRCNMDQNLKVKK